VPAASAAVPAASAALPAAVAAATAGAGAGVTTAGVSAAGALGFSPQAVRDNASKAATRAKRFIYFSFTIIKFTYKSRGISVRYNAKLQRIQNIVYQYI
jgi:hypothetical protein